MNKHTATVNGHTMKRNSASRIYTHVVVVVDSEASKRADAEARLAAEFDWEKAREGRGVRVRTDRFQPAPGETKADYVARRMAEFTFTPNAPDGTSVGAWGWAGRHDLAQAQANKARKLLPYADVLVVPAVVRA
jgi:hypothetical protein